MFKDIPQVIRETFWKHLLLSAAIVGFGIIWSVIAGDRILSLLTGTIALLSAVRLVSLYRSIKVGILRRWKAWFIQIERKCCATATSSPCSFRTEVRSANASLAEHY